MKKEYIEPTFKAKKVMPLVIMAGSEVTTSRAHTGTATVIINDVSSSWTKSSSGAKKASAWDSEE